MNWLSSYYAPSPPLISNFQIEHFTFYEKSDNVLFEIEIVEFTHFNQGHIT